MLKIFLETEAKILSRIKSREVTICVIGTGTIGLPVATLFADKGFRVIGYDVNSERVTQINQGTCLFEYADLLKQVVNKGNLYATTEPGEAVAKADIITICVPTPLQENNEVNLSYLTRAQLDIVGNLQRGTLIIVESSVPPGTTREMGEAIQKSTGMKMGIDFGLAYCPERYNPTLPVEIHPRVLYDHEQGENEYTLNKLSRVVSSFDDKSPFIAKSLYHQITTGNIFEVSSPEVAEIAKVFENAFRDVNIALVNELSKLCSRLGLDTFEVIEAARTKPFAFMAHYPGAGVGGECIPVDPWYLIKLAERLGYETKIMKAAREVNDSMPDYVVRLTETALSKAGRKLNQSRVCVLGLAYKENTTDTRGSPALSIIELLSQRGAEVQACDPLVQREGTDFQLVPLEEAFNNVDAVILVTKHDIFRGIELEEIKKGMRTLVIIDGRNFFTRNYALSLGFIYEGVGKPSFADL